MNETNEIRQRTLADRLLALVQQAGHNTMLASSVNNTLKAEPRDSGSITCAACCVDEAVEQIACTLAHQRLILLEALERLGDFAADAPKKCNMGQVQLNQQSNLKSNLAKSPQAHQADQRDVNAGQAGPQMQAPNAGLGNVSPQQVLSGPQQILRRAEQRLYRAPEDFQG